MSKVLLICYDNGSFISTFPMGTAYIAQALLDAGHEVEIYNQDVYHYPPEHLTEKLSTDRYDVVGLGFCAGYWQYLKFLEISDAINKAKHRPLYILGGHGPSPEPEFFLRKGNADVVVIGEGEEAIVELLQYGYTNDGNMGIYYRIGDTVFQKPRREPPQDLSKFPAWELFPIEHYCHIRYPNAENTDRCFPVIGGRGCSFKCSFCYRLEEGLRVRSPWNIIAEIALLKGKYGINYIIFHEELFMSSRQRVEEMCKAIIDAKLNIKWYCQGRLNYAKPDILKLMKDAGCVFINYGIEAMDDRVLRLMNKKLTIRQIRDGIQATSDAGITPGFNIIFGNLGDTERTLQKGVEFLLGHGDFSQLITVRPVTPYPGCDLYYYAIEKGLLKDVADFYERKHTNSDLMSVNFTNLPEYKFYNLLFSANATLLEAYYNHQKERTYNSMAKLYCERDASFRGFRQT